LSSVFTYEQDIVAANIVRFDLPLNGGAW
jgi:hypothetical protein